MKLYLSTPSSKIIKIEHTDYRFQKRIEPLLYCYRHFIPILASDNLSNSDDAMVMQKGLKLSNGLVDIHHAGTAMRFLTAYFASQEGKEVVLTGSQRMTERPIKVLVEALDGHSGQRSPMKIKKDILHFASREKS